jgi:hypothetical protein
MILLVAASGRKGVRDLYAVLSYMLRQCEVVKRNYSAIERGAFCGAEGPGRVLLVCAARLLPDLPAPRPGDAAAALPGPRCEWLGLGNQPAAANTL